MGFTDFMVSISEAPQIKLLHQLGEHVTLNHIPLEIPWHPNSLEILSLCNRTTVRGEALQYG